MFNKKKKDPYTNYKQALKYAKNHIIKDVILFHGGNKADNVSASLLNYHLAKSMNRMTLTLIVVNVILVVINVVSLFLFWQSLNQ